MYDCAANAFFIGPGQVLGKKLQHFTVGHLFLLEAIKSPFILSGKLETSDLLLAVLICSQPFAVSCDLLACGAEALRESAFQLGRKVRIKKWNINEQCAAFDEYVQAYLDMPERLTKTAPGEKVTARTSAFPFAARIAWCLMERMPENAAWNMPLSRALLYYGIKSEANGAEYFSEKDIEIINKMIEERNATNDLPAYEFDEANRALKERKEHGNG